MDEWRLPLFTVEQVVIPFTQIIDWGVKDFGIADLWTEFGTGKGVKVCVLDTGQPVHRDLIEGLGVAKDFTGSIRGAKDMNGHGTHCAGIIGSRNNELSAVGIAPECTVLCGKVLGDNGSGPAQSIAAGIDWALEQGAEVISMSLGSAYPSTTIKSAIDSIPNSVILCCAAGNSGPGESWEYPGAWPRALCVASINQSRAVSHFSSRNTQVDIAAPGEKITNCWPGDQVATLSGTSMATPYIAGLAAIAVGYCKSTGRVGLTHSLFASMLQDSADDIGPAGTDPASGYGIANPRKLFDKVRSLKVLTPQPPPTTWEAKISVEGSALPKGVYPIRPPT